MTDDRDEAEPDDPVAAAVAGMCDGCHDSAELRLVGGHLREALDGHDPDDGLSAADLCSALLDALADAVRVARERLAAAPAAGGGR